MIIEDPVYGPMAGGLHRYPHCGARERCLGGWQCLQSANMHRGVGLTRVRCQHDAQGRECPSLHVCAYEHWQPCNTMHLRFVIGIDLSAATACCREEVGVRGRGMEHGQGQFSGYFVCNSSHPAWDMPGPMTQAGYRFMSKGRNRRNVRQGWGSLAQSGGAATTPGYIRPGDHNGNRHGSRFHQLWPSRGGIELSTGVVREPS